VLAVSVQLLPERVDLLGLVLQGAGGGALAATGWAVIRGAGPARRARWVELGNIYGAAGGLLFFLVLVLSRGVF
jgi:hypothetical protein